MVTSKIGIFGGAGSGKSEVTKILKNKYNAVVIEADKVAHELYNVNESGYKAILNLCGKGILDAKFNIDRKLLADLIYNDDKLLKKVNESIHPLVYEKVVSILTDLEHRDEKYLVVYEAAILPRDYDINLDARIYVYSPESTRRDRLKHYRGYSDERVDSIFSKQSTDQEYRAYCDYVINNIENFDRLEEQVDAALKYCQRKQR